MRPTLQSPGLTASSRSLGYSMLIPLILQLVQLGIEVAPSIIAAGKLELDAHGGASLTAAERAQVDEAMEAAHAALQAAEPTA